MAEMADSHQCYISQAFSNTDNQDVVLLYQTRCLKFQCISPCTSFNIKRIIKFFTLAGTGHSFRHQLVPQCLK